MTKVRFLAAAFSIALLSLFGFSAANAAYTQSFDVNVNGGTVEPGASFSVTFTSTYACTSWTLNEFEGQTAPGGSGTSYTVELTAPDAEGTYPISANCTWDPATVGIVAPAESSSAVVPAIYSSSASTSTASNDTLLAAPQVDTANGTVVVGSGSSDGDGDGDDNGALPDTGGSNAKLLLIGGGLVVAGAGVAVASRRRKSVA